MDNGVVLKPKVRGTAVLGIHGGHSFSSPYLLGFFLLFLSFNVQFYILLFTNVAVREKRERMEKMKNNTIIAVLDNVIAVQRTGQSSQGYCKTFLHVFSWHPKTGVGGGCNSRMDFYLATHMYACMHTTTSVLPPLHATIPVSHQKSGRGRGGGDVLCSSILMLDYNCKLPLPLFPCQRGDT